LAFVAIGCGEKTEAERALVVVEETNNYLAAKAKELGDLEAKGYDDYLAAYDAMTAEMNQTAKDNGFDDLASAESAIRAKSDSLGLAEKDVALFSSPLLRVGRLTAFAFECERRYKNAPRYLDYPEEYRAQKIYGDIGERNGTMTGLARLKGFESSDAAFAEMEKLAERDPQAAKTFGALTFRWSKKERAADYARDFLVLLEGFRKKREEIADIDMPQTAELMRQLLPMEYEQQTSRLSSYYDIRSAEECETTLAEYADDDPEIAALKSDLEEYADLRRALEEEDS